MHLPVLLYWWVNLNYQIMLMRWGTPSIFGEPLLSRSHLIQKWCKGFTCLLLIMQSRSSSMWQFCFYRFLYALLWWWILTYGGAHNLSCLDNFGHICSDLLDADGDYYCCCFGFHAIFLGHINQTVEGLLIWEDLLESSTHKRTSYSGFWSPKPWAS